MVMASSLGAGPTWCCCRPTLPSTPSACGRRGSRSFAAAGGVSRPPALSPPSGWRARRPKSRSTSRGAPLGQARSRQCRRLALSLAKDARHTMGLPPHAARAALYCCRLRMATPSDTAISDYWAREGLGRAILDALAAAGKNLDALTIDDLAPADQLHGGGKDATLRLARLAGLTPGLRVLDVGGGLGGPARTLAVEFGCRVTTIDLTESYVRAAELLTARLRPRPPAPT